MVSAGGQVEIVVIALAEQTSQLNRLGDVPANTNGHCQPVVFALAQVADTAREPSDDQVDFLRRRRQVVQPRHFLAVRLDLLTAHSNRRRDPLEEGANRG